MNENIKSRWQKLETWLTNRFWYYHKWYYLLAVFVLTVIVIWVYRAATKVDYDWNIVYAHMGDSEPETVERIKALLSQHATDITGNGKVDISVYEICHTQEDEETGENEFFAALYGHDYYIMLVDSDIYELYRRLGYFESLYGDGEEDRGVYIESLSLYAVVNDAPPLQYTPAQAEERDISEEYLKALNEGLKEEHETLTTQAIEIVKKLAD
ncbi:MAG: hypothetical protein GX254_06875 [Clostridiales bacterium]|jgi:hypothetical protein|nr:hypothetical protein [Clostridiales bacterium]